MARGKNKQQYVNSLYAALTAEEYDETVEELKDALTTKEDLETQKCLVGKQREQFQRLKSWVKILEQK